jgi:hypothetical protein
VNTPDDVDRAGARTVDSKHVAQRMRRRSARLVATVLEQLSQELPAYGALPREELATDVTFAVRRSLAAFVSFLETGSTPTAQLHELRESASRRAEEGLPLDVVLSAYLLGARKTFDSLNRSVTAEQAPDALTIAGFTFDFLRVTCAEVVAGYMEEYQTIAGAELTAHQRLMQALLRDDTAAIDDHFGTQAGSFVAVTLAIGPHADERAPGTDAAIAAWRKLRRLRAELRSRTAGRFLAQLSPTGGFVLVPVTGSVGEEMMARDLLTALTEAAQAPLLAAAVDCSSSNVRNAMTLSREVLDLLSALRKPSGLYRLDDVALELQISRAGPLGPHLAQPFRALEPHPDLVATLEALISNGLSRRLTARQLHVHANTVDYRLRRIATLTGCDPSDTTQMFRLMAALVATRVAEG